MKDSFVVIKKGGVQHIVSPGEEIVINRIDGEKGDVIEIKDTYLYKDDEKTEIGSPTTEYVVKAEILDQFKGPKMQIRTFKAKSRYRRKKGHRQLLTRLKIKEISKASSSDDAAKKSEKKDSKSSKSKDSKK